jgi:hypothetical protein
LLTKLENDFDIKWKDAGKGWRGTESELKLHGWTRSRRVIVLRRRADETKGTRAKRRRRKRREPLPLLAMMGLSDIYFGTLNYEYQILVTNLKYGMEALADLYRERGDAENPFDELKNQWGWSGFTSHKLSVSQISARLNALVYNWWTLYARQIDPDKHHEAITSRPRILSGVCRQSDHAGKRHLSVSILHSESKKLCERITNTANILQKFDVAAEQFSDIERLRGVLRLIFPREMNDNGPEPPKLTTHAA